METIQVIRDDGQCGTVVQRLPTAEAVPQLVIAFADGSRLVVPEDVLVAQPDGTYHLRVHGTALGTQGATGAVADESFVIPVVAEELTVEKRRVTRGRIYSKVTERQAEEQVRLRDETIRVQRRPVRRVVSTTDPDLFRERSYEMTEIDEEAVVNIRAQVIEEVVIGKEVAEKIETIHQTLRRTDVEIEEAPGVRSFAEYGDDFRGYYTQRLAKSGLGYDKYSPAFRFGYGLAANEPFRSQPWETIEPDVRRLWEEKNPGTWGQLKDAIRFSWERVRGAR